MKIQGLGSKILIGAAFLLGLFAGFHFHEASYFKERMGPNFQLQRLYPPNSGHLVNPLLQVEGPRGGNAKLLSAESRFRNYVEERVMKKDVSDVSVYLRDINAGTWVGVNEDVQYQMASLGKVPLIFTFFLKAQKDPSVLYKKVTYDKPINVPVAQNIVPQKSIQLGGTYSVEELLRNTLVYSDNLSMYLLYQDNDIDEKLIDQIYSDIHLPVPQGGQQYYISAKDYARYFRMLYSATYISKDSSEKLLKMLTESDFREGIPAGVPENITVAHKFGERGEGIEAVQLHDCGIVYYPDSPYLLCLMTKGWNFDTLKNVIQDISKIAYEEISASKR